MLFMCLLQIRAKSGRFLGVPVSKSGAGRWNWTDANAQNSTNTNINYITVEKDVQNHPIFKWLPFGGANDDALYMYEGTTLPAINAYSRVPNLPFNGSAWNSDLNDDNHLLATYNDNNASRPEHLQMHELMLDEAAKYILIAISTENSGFAYLNEDGLQLLRNAVDYLTNPNIYYDYQLNMPIGDDDGYISDDAKLRRITTSVGMITPEFNAAITEYSMEIESSATSITVTATPNFRGASVDGDGVLPISTGENIFPIVVTAQDGETKMTYTLTVNVIAPTPVTPSNLPQRQMERLDRGLVAIRTGSNVFLSWRLYATDPTGVMFNIYQNEETTPVNPEPLDVAHTNFTLINGSASAVYSVATLLNGKEIERSKPVNVWSNRANAYKFSKMSGY